MPTSVGIQRAKALGLDLVLVSPSADPPVCKVIDYGEYTYQEKKKKNEAKKKQHRIEIKEVKFRPNTDQHDYDFKKNHALRFLTEGNKVKATVFFRGREITHANLGEKLIFRLAKDLSELGDVEGRPRLEGRMMHVMRRQQASPPKRSTKNTGGPTARFLSFVARRVRDLLLLWRTHSCEHRGLHRAVSPFVATSRVGSGHGDEGNRVCFRQLDPMLTEMSARLRRTVALRPDPGGFVARQSPPSLDQPTDHARTEEAGGEGTTKSGELCTLPLPMSPSSPGFNLLMLDRRRRRSRVALQPHRRPSDTEATARSMSIGEKGAGRRPPPLNPGGPRSNGSYLSLGEVVPSTRIPIPTGSGSSPLQETIGETEPRSPITRPTREVQSFSPEELDRRPGGAAESRVTRRALSALRGDARRSVFATPGLSACEHLS